MRRALILSVALLSLISCMQPGAERGTNPATETVADVATEASPLDIYVARRKSGDLVSQVARFPGRFGIINGCLTFSLGERIYLPVFSPLSPVEVLSDRVVFGRRSVAFGKDSMVVGGEYGIGAADQLDQKPPNECPRLLLKVRQVQ